MISITRGTLLVLAMLMLGINPASAQGTSHAADALIASGIQLREQGRDEDALAVFRQAHELSPSAKTLAQMGLAEQALGAWVDAYQHLTAALQEHDEWIDRPRTRTAIQGALNTVQENVGRLGFRGGVDGAEVYVEGQLMGTLPFSAPVPVRAGAVQLMVRAPGYVSIQRSVTVRAGALARESLVMAPDPNTHMASTSSNGTHVGSQASNSATPATSSTSSSSSGGGSIVPLVLMISGGAVALSAIAPYAMSFGKASDYNSDACLSGGLTRDQNCSSLRDDASQLQTISVVLLGGGVAIAATGLVLQLVGGGHSTERATASRLQCGPGPGELGAACQLAF